MEELRRRVRSIFTHGPNKTINMLNLRPRDASQSRAYYNSDTDHELLGVGNLKKHLTQIRAEYNNVVSIWEAHQCLASLRTLIVIDRFQRNVCNRQSLCIKSYQPHVRAVLLYSACMAC